MHFSWKEIWLHRLALVLLIPLAALLLAVTFNPTDLLRPVLVALFYTVGPAGTFLSCLAMILGLWIGYFALLVFLRENLRKQQEARKAIESLHWVSSRAMMMTRGEFAEFVSDSGNLLTIRLELDGFRITDISSYFGTVELLVTRRSITNTQAPGDAVALHDVSRLRGDINVHANQLRIALA